MTKRRKDTDYLFLSARIRSLERNLLTAQRLEQLLQAPSAENCSQLLSDLGYDPIRDEATLQASLKKQREDVFAELERFMPEKELLDVFRIKYDYHNIKVLLKAPEGAERLLMDAGTIPAGDLQRQYADGGSWQFLPGDMAAAAEKAAQLLAETGSAQRSDCVLDRACFAQLEKLAADSRCDYLQRYVRAMIDAANLRSLIRTQRLGLDAGFLREVLFPGGSVTPEAIRANTRIVNILQDFGRTRGMTSAQVTLGWLLQKAPWIVPIPGTTKLAHLEENLHTLDFACSPSEWQELERGVAAIPIVGNRYNAEQQRQVGF